MAESALSIILAEAQNETELTTELADLTRSAKFTPPLRVYGGESKVVKLGQFPLNHLGIYKSKDIIEDLGEQVEAVVIARRPRASILTSDKPISFFKPGNPNYEHVKTRALSKEKNYLVGLEFLFWLPATGQFVTFFCGNATLRNEAAKINSQMGRHVIIKTKIISNTQNVWCGIETLACSEPDENLPAEQLFLETLDEFKNPLDSEVQMTDQTQNQQQQARAR